MNRTLCVLNVYAGSRKNSEDRMKVPVLDRQHLPELSDLHDRGDYVIDLLSEDVLSSLMGGTGKVDTFIIMNRFAFSDTDGKGVRELLVRCFMILKAISPFVMLNKGCRFWLVYCPYEVDKDNSYRDVMHTSLKEGLVTLTQVFAIEMVKKRININFIAMQDMKFWAKCRQLMVWATGCEPLNLTAQEFIFEE